MVFEQAMVHSSDVFKRQDITVLTMRTRQDTNIDPFIVSGAIK